MFEGFHTPSQLTRHKELPASIAHHMPAIIASSIARHHDATHRLLRVFPRRWPSITGLQLELGSGHKPDMHIKTFSLDYDQLCGKKLGSRILSSAVEFGLDPRHRFDTITANWPTMALIKTAVKVIEDSGLGIVTLENNGVRYGQNETKPLEAITQDKPPLPGEIYTIERLEAHLGHDEL